MTNSLQTFDFNSHPIRVVEMKENPWFVATDVYSLLFGRTTGIAARLYLDEAEMYVARKQSAPDALTSLFTGTAGRVALLSESGLYKLILRSDKPVAKPFQNWVTQVVLPTIRKDGGYILGEEKVVTGEMDEDTLILRAMEVMKRKVERLQSEKALVVSLQPTHQRTRYVQRSGGSERLSPLPPEIHDVGSGRPFVVSIGNHGPNPINARHGPPVAKTGYVNVVIDGR